MEKTLTKKLKESEEVFDYSSAMGIISDSINSLADAVGSLYQSGNKYCEPFQKMKIELIELANQFKDEYDKPYEIRFIQTLTLMAILLFNFVILRYF